MRLTPILLLLTVTGAIDAGERTGTIVGTVRYLDDPPAARRILTADGVTIEHRALAVDPKTKGLRDVAVILDTKVKAAPAPERPVVIDQRDMVFVPRVAVAQEGQTVRFENNDLGNHGVRSAAARPENNFDVTTPPGQAFEFRFQAAREPVPIGCQLHPWMQAWIYVVRHPYFAVTDAQGQFRIDNVPAGKHTLLVAHPETKRQERIAVDIAAGKTTPVRIDWRK